MTEFSNPYGQGQCRSEQGREDAMVSLFVSVLMLFLVLAMFAVVEGGRKVATSSLAHDVAAEAARSAAATLLPESLAVGAPRIDKQQAMENAQSLVDGWGEFDATLTIEFPTEDTVRAIVRISRDSWMPGLDLSAEARHVASVIEAGAFSEVS